MRLSCQRSVSFALLLLPLLLTACSDSSEPATPAAPTPAPPATFTVSGTIFETAPTTGTPVSGAHVAVGPVAAVTNASGAFTVSGVPAGSYTLTAAKADFETRTLAVTVSTANVSGLTLNMRPTRIIETEYNGELTGHDERCGGTSLPCDVYPVVTHSDGVLTAFLVWSTPNVRFDLELVCNGILLDEALEKEDFVREARTDVKATQQCEARVMLRGGESSKYGLFLKHPQ